MRKTWILIMALLMIMLCLPAEAEFHKTGYPIVDEPVTFTVMNPQASTGGPWGDNMVFFTAMKDLTGVDFTFSNTPQSDWATKVNLALASGELPDVFMSDVTADNIFVYGVQSGLFLDISDLIPEYMPNLMKMLDKYPDFLKVVTQTNGAIYSFPKLLRTATSGTGIIYINTDIMKAAGVEKLPSTLDEFYDTCMAIKEYKKDDPNFVTFVPQNVNAFNQHFELHMIGAFGDYVNAGFNDDGTGKVFYNGITDQYKNYLAFVNKLYKDGIIHPDMYSMDEATALAMVKEGRCAITTIGTQMPIEQHEDGTYNVAVLPLFTSEYTDTLKVASSNMISDSGIVISAKCKNPEILLRWFDIYYSEEDVAPGLNSVSPWLGVRGETWDYTDETHQYYHRPQPRDPEMNSTTYIQTYGAPQNYLGLDMTAIQQGGSFGNTVKGLGSVAYIYPYAVPQFPLNRNGATTTNLLKFTEEEQETYTNTMVDIDAYVDQMKAKFITGVEPIENFDKYVETLKTMGLEKVLGVVQAAYDRYR